MPLRSAARQIDALLRGGYTEKHHLAEGRLELPVRTLLLASVVLGAVYGVFMGLFAVLRPTNPSVEQLLATTVKVPLLFLATLFVTFPSLYVFSALSRSRLEPLATLKLLLAAVAVNLTVLASFGPVTGFFTLSTDSYPFLVLLNVTFFLVSGVVGLAFLAKALDGVFQAEPEDAPRAGLGDAPARADESAAEAPSAVPGSARPNDPWPSGAVAPRPGEHAPSGAATRQSYYKAPSAPKAPGRGVLRVWILIYAVVGAQMAWILRPFIGAPNAEFTFFRQRGGNFLKAILEALSDL